MAHLHVIPVLSYEPLHDLALVGGGARRRGLACGAFLVGGRPQLCRQQNTNMGINLLGTAILCAAVAGCCLLAPATAACLLVLPEVLPGAAAPRSVTAWVVWHACCSPSSSEKVSPSSSSRSSLLFRGCLAWLRPNPSLGSSRSLLVL